MNKKYQKIVGQERIGDCLKTSLSCIFELDYNLVPNFGTLMEREIDDYVWSDCFCSFMRNELYHNPCYYSVIPSDRIGELCLSMYDIGKESLHSVVELNGLVIHDPFPAPESTKYDKYLEETPVARVYFNRIKSKPICFPGAAQTTVFPLNEASVNLSKQYADTPDATKCSGDSELTFAEWKNFYYNALDGYDGVSERNTFTQ